MKLKNSKSRQAIFCLMYFLFKTETRKLLISAAVEDAFRKVQVNPQRLKLNGHISLWSVLIINIHGVWKWICQENPRSCRVSSKEVVLRLLVCPSQRLG